MARDLIIGLVIGFILGAGFVISMTKHDSARLQVQFGEVIVAMQTSK